MRTGRTRVIIVDTALEERRRQGKPVRVAMVGAGYMGRGIARQILTAIPGMRLVAVAARVPARAERAYREAGADKVFLVENLHELDNAIAMDVYAVTADASLLCASSQIDAVIEVTGDVEFGAQVALEAIAGRKHVILMNAELDATIGPILKHHADRAGVVFTNADGDQPGVILNLFRFVRAIGYQPVLAGNIKGLQDPYRTPTTQQAFAAAHNQRAHMVTSFADGTKIAAEMAVVANATGFKVGRRGMYGPRCGHVREAASLFPIEQLLDGGLVDYVLGAEPGPGVFVLGYNDDPIKQPYLDYLKMGTGPLYVFYQPYHLCHLEVPFTAARAVLFGDAAVAPLKGPVCDVIAVAKQDLRAGDMIDGLGGYSCYGVLENSEISRAEGLLPMGLAPGCQLTRDIARDEPIAYRDVVVPRNRLSDRLRAEQDQVFGNGAVAAASKPRSGGQLSC
jgi:predicted homoserine dehydrogenase-like protein